MSINSQGYRLAALEDLLLQVYKGAAYNKHISLFLSCSSLYVALVTFF